MSINQPIHKSIHISTVAKASLAITLGVALFGYLATPAGATTARHTAKQGSNQHNTMRNPIIEGLAGPLGLAVASPTKIAVAESFAGTLDLFKRGTLTPVVSAPGTDISGTAFGDHGELVYTQTIYPPGTEGEGNSTAATLNQVTKNGPKLLGDLHAYEFSANPDSTQLYGFLDLPSTCDLSSIPDAPPPTPYNGIKDSHAYAVANAGHGAYYVADAAGNDIVRISATGQPSTVAVLPPVKVKVTQAIVDSGVIPQCALGSTFAFEPVPTDVEVGRDGYLYVSGLTGASEVLGAGGKVWRVNPHTGSVREIASGLLGAVDLALSPDGTIYVAELFGNQVSKISCGRVSEAFDVVAPGAIEWFGGRLYVSNHALTPPLGTIRTFRG